MVPKALEPGGGVSPWASVAAGGQAHVCGCYFVLYNKLLEVHEVADGREPSTSQGPGRERRPGGQGPGGRTQEAVLFTPRSPARSQILRWVLHVSKGRHEQFVLLEACLYGLLI